MVIGRPDRLLSPYQKESPAPESLVEGMTEAGLTFHMQALFATLSLALECATNMGVLLVLPRSRKTQRCRANEKGCLDGAPLLFVSS